MYKHIFYTNIYNLSMFFIPSLERWNFTGQAAVLYIYTTSKVHGLSV